MIKKHGGNVYKFARENGLDIHDVLDFSANINPYGMSKQIEANLSEMLIKSLNYPDPDYRRLKKAISTFENINEEHILIGNGAIECIFLLAEYLKSKHIMISAPTFVEYERAFEKYETKITYYNSQINADFDVHHYLNALPDDLETLIICNPNNPTGYLTKRDDLLMILDHAREKGIVVIVDEAFIDFTSDEDSHTLKTYLDAYSHLVILKSLTKFFAMPGLRLGYMMTSHATLLSDILSERMPWAINSFASECAIISLKDDEYIQKTKKWIQLERKWFYNQLDKISGIAVYPSEGNYLFFYTKEDKLDQKLASYGIMIRNCNNYRNLKEGFFRVAIKDRSSNEKLISSLGEIYGYN